MKAKPWLLPLVMAGSLSLIYVLPQAGEMAESAARMDLPRESVGWQFEAKAASEAEIKTLGGETKFSKALCIRPRLGETGADGRALPDLMELSIVLSGSDLNTSIHRPERCMPAQGHRIMEAKSIPLEVDGGHHFRAKRLLSVRTVPAQDAGGKPWELNCVTYYFFVGRNQITDNHLERTLIDMKDRLLHGLDQRWAYVSATMIYGKPPWLQGREFTLEEADQKLAEFLSTFAAEQIDWKRIDG
jgi:Protein of unknown function (DUF3485)